MVSIYSRASVGLFFASILFAQSALAELSFVKDATGQTIGVSVKPETIRTKAYLQAKTSVRKVRAQVRAFVSRYQKEIGLDASGFSLKAGKVNRGRKGIIHARYHQLYNGVPVLGAEAIFHLNVRRQITSAALKLVSDRRVDTTSLVTKEDAEVLAAATWREVFNSSLDPVINGANLVILPGELADNARSDKVFVAWEIGLFSENPVSDELYYIDAKTGEFLRQITRLRFLNRKVWDCAKWPGTSYCYIDSLLSGYYYGRSESAPVRGPYPRAQYPLYYGSLDVDQIHNLLGVTHNYWLNTFGRNGANDQGGLSKSPLSDTVAYVHVDNTNPANCPDNAWYGSSTSGVAFCRRMATPDLVGHEYTHGTVLFLFTDTDGNPVGTIFQGQTGSLEESFADLSAEGVELAATGAHDWHFGIFQDVPPGTYPSSSYGIFRVLDTPAERLDARYSPPLVYPDRSYSEGVYCGTEDSGGTHHNSTIPSYAFYLMSEGGDYNGCHINPIGFAASQQVLYNAWENYFTRTVTFNEAYLAINDACQALYSTTHPEYCVEVEKALQAVEMDQMGICLDPSGEHYHTPACAQTPLPGAVDPARPDLETTLLFAPDENVYSLGQEWTGVDTVRAVLCDAGAKRMDGSAIVPFNGVSTEVTVNQDGSFAESLWDGAQEGQFEIVIDRNGDWIYDPIEDRTVAFDVRAPVDGDGLCYQGENLITSEDCHDAPTDCACSVGYACARMTADVNGPYECRKRVKPSRYNVMMLPELER